MRRKKSEAHEPIDQAEIDRLRELIEREEELEEEIKREIVSHDRRMLQGLRRIEDRNRRLIMWIGVIILMLMIVGFWVSRLDVIISPPSGSPVNKMIDLSAARQEMNETLQDVLTGIDEIKARARQMEEGATATGSLPIKTK